MTARQGLLLGWEMPAKQKVRVAKGEVVVVSWM